MSVTIISKEHKIVWVSKTRLGQGFSICVSVMVRTLPMITYFRTVFWVLHEVLTLISYLGCCECLKLTWKLVPSFVLRMRELNKCYATPRKSVCACVNITVICIANVCERVVKCSECCQNLKMEATSMFCLFYENASGIMNVTT
jgi:hypothetical protein